MVSLIPIEAFQLAGRRIVVCKYDGPNANDVVGATFAILANGNRVGTIKINGICTASNIQGSVFDYSYSGDELPVQLADCKLSEIDVP